MSPRNQPQLGPLAVNVQGVVERALDVVPADRRDRQCTPVALARDPAQVHQTRCDCGADRAGKMRPTLAPVDAGAAEGSAAATCLRDVDTKLAKEFFARVCDDASIVVQLDMVMGLQRVGKRDAKLA